ncbi:MAG: hypothetical protein ACRDBQ_15255 [Shewanella sp.]
MSKFTIGDQVVEHRNPNKVFIVVSVDGTSVYITRSTNGTNFESKSCPEQFLDPAEPKKTSSQPMNTRYSINPERV